MHDRVVTWTRASPAAGEALEVEWTVAADPDLKEVVASGMAVADPTPERVVGEWWHLDTVLRPSSAENAPPDGWWSGAHPG